MVGTKGLIAGIFAVVIVAIIAGCAGAEVADCGTDKTCLDQKWANCTPAKALLSQEQSAGGTGALAPKLTASMYYEVKGGVPEACGLYVRVEGVQVPGVPEAQKALVEAAFEGVKGKDMECIFPATQNVAQINDAMLKEKCTGALVDFAKSASVPGLTPTTPSGGTTPSGTGTTPPAGGNPFGGGLFGGG